jgi:hypothetical protein
MEDQVIKSNRDDMLGFGGICMEDKYEEHNTDGV